MTSSSFLAVRTLQQCIRDNAPLLRDQDRENTVLTAALSAFYMDDFLHSVADETQAAQLIGDISLVLKSGHFELHKWNSNAAHLLSILMDQRIAPQNQPATELLIDSSDQSVLGLQWNPMHDMFFYRVDLEQHDITPTKRRVLSKVAKLYDPTGLLAPVVVTGKIFIQTLVAEGLRWDDPLPDALQQQWDIFYNQLTVLNDVRVPRWLGITPNGAIVIQGFCDASPCAYGAAIYIKTSREGRFRVELLTARTRVAPIKGSTIPRLELCAAWLLAQTMDSIRTALAIRDVPYYLWSDSRVVLCWLRKSPHVLQSFVSNRVQKVQELTTKDSWGYVRSADNPADCASRGITALELMSKSLWWQGSTWLYEANTPSYDGPVLADLATTLVAKEKRRVTLLMTQTSTLSITTRRRDGAIISLTERFSSLQRLLRTVALILRWTPSRAHRRHQTIIHSDELEDALKTLLRMEQRKHFAIEISRLMHHTSLPTTSRLLPLNPFLDAEGILRLGGRLSEGNLPEDRRFPIILPKSGAISTLLIQRAHRDTLHGGTQLMLRTLRARYWLIHARQAVRTQIHNCVVCRRHRGAIQTQQMAPLPTMRITPARPFSASGVDYCGPFQLRVGTKRSRAVVKTYLAIFICMVTKAVHIEVVDDLSAPAFLDAFTRFISRRGPCRDLYSDNGTTFRGADRLLREDLAAWHNEHNQQTLADGGTHWHFIAPRAPHQGGLWEAAVKSAKRHLTKIIGQQQLYKTQMHTLSVRIEHV